MLPFIRSDINHVTGYTSHFKSSLKSLEQSEITSAVTKFDHLDKNENPFDLPHELKQMLTCIYQQQIEVNRYPDHEHTTLKEAIAEYVNESASLHRQPKGITCTTPNNISVGVGADELIQSLLIATCVSKEGTILIAKPTFPMYEILAQILGIPVVAVGRDEKNFEIDMVAAQLAIETTQNPPIRIVFAVHPNSPTGNLLTVSELDWLRCLPEEIMVVVDEAYFEFSQTTAVGELLKRPNWVVLRTFSKAFRLAAHRIGYAIADPALTTILEKIRLPYNLSSFSQKAAQVVLAHRQVLMSSIPQILAERDRLICTLAQNPSLQVWPSAANFFYLRLQEHSDDGLALLYSYLKAQGTLVRPLGGGLRITVGNNDENTRMLERLQTFFCV